MKISQVTWTRTVEDSRFEILHHKFDLVLLDVGLPDGSGFEVAPLIRKQCPATALSFFLTAFGTAEDRIRGLELGAEDYVVKPFHLKELILRIRNGLKRAQALSQSLQELSSEIQVGRAIIHFKRFEAQVGDQIYPLTHKESALLKILIEKRGSVVSRDEILDLAWSEDEFPTPRTVDNFILRLRKLVEIHPDKPEVIKSVRKIGYLLV